MALEEEPVQSRAYVLSYYPPAQRPAEKSFLEYRDELSLRIVEKTAAILHHMGEAGRWYALSLQIMVNELRAKLPGLIEQDSDALDKYLFNSEAYRRAEEYYFTIRKRQLELGSALSDIIY